jgi:hypothetical protein
MRLDKLAKTLTDMKAIAQQVAASWTSPKSGVEPIEEQRRSLMTEIDASVHVRSSNNFNGDRGRGHTTTIE